MTRRPGPTPRTADQVGVGLHVQPQLPVDQLLGADHESGHAHQDGGAATTFNNGQGLLFLQTCIPQNGGALARDLGLPNQQPNLTASHTSSR